MKRWGANPFSLFNWIFPGYFKASASFDLSELIGALGQMAITHLNNSCTHKVTKNMKIRETSFRKYSVWSTAARIAATTLRGNRTLCEFREFTTDKCYGDLESDFICDFRLPTSDFRLQTSE